MSIISHPAHRACAHGVNDFLVGVAKPLQESEYENYIGEHAVEMFKYPSICDNGIPITVFDAKINIALKRFFSAISRF